jgi:signal transduction histidine kinase
MRRQLTILVASTTSVVVIAFLVPLALLVGATAQDRAVSAATQEAQNVALLVALLTDEAELASAVQLANDQSGRATTVFLPSGATVGAPARVTAGVRRARAGAALTHNVSGGREVVQPVTTGAGRAVVRTLVPDELLRRGVTRAWVTLALLGLVILAVAVLVADRLARSIAGPLADLAGAARALGEGRLDTRVEPVGPPEVVELATVMNRLAERISASLAAERELVADLSHRLRTPITALRLDTETVADDETAERLAADVDALERAVDEVIREARRSSGEVATSCDAATILRERVAFWTALAEDQGRAVTLDVPDVPVLVGVSPGDLAAAVDGLLANVLAHTPEGTPFDVRLEAVPAGGAVLLIEDAGPGFGPDALERGRSGAGSTGLGLDIARRTAEASRGRLWLGRSPAGGASVRLELGPPPAGDDRSGRVQLR